MSVLMCTFLDFMELYRQCNLLIEERTGDNLIKNNVLKLKKTGKIVTHQINQFIKDYPKLFLNDGDKAIWIGNKDIYLEVIQILNLFQKYK